VQQLCFLFESSFKVTQILDEMGTTGVTHRPEAGRGESKTSGGRSKKKNGTGRGESKTSGAGGAERLFSTFETRPNGHPD